LRASFDVPVKAITATHSLPREVWGANSCHG
jgi:hypothetical protein